MTFESFENIVSLLCTIAGLLYCVFKYVENPKRGYRFIIAFFLANFLSEYYWTIYELIMHSYPNVSEFVAYLGWNIGFVCLLVAVFHFRHTEAKRFFHPLILLPILVNVPQLILYCSFGGVLNNIWEVGFTTLTEIFCLQELLYVWKHKEKRRPFPLFSLFVLIYLITTYGKWTSSCFDWENELLSPYLYCSIISALSSVLFVYAAVRHYAAEDRETGVKNASKLRFQMVLQTAACIVILGICAAGFLIALKMRSSLVSEDGVFRDENRIVIYLFIISAVLILLILILLYVLNSRYRRLMELGRKMEDKKRNRLNFVFTIVITLALMAFAVIYNSNALYNASVVSVYENGKEEVKTLSTELENYLAVAVTTLRVTADSVDLMIEEGRSLEEIFRYITDQTIRQSVQFDENFTGIYAYINGAYMDGNGWIPPKGYEPTSRDWYKTAVEADGEVVIVSPYVDAQTGSVVITVAQCISNASEAGPDRQNIVCLDVIVNYIQEVTQSVELSGKGYGMVINADGFIIAHKEDELNGENLADVYGQDILDIILKTGSGRVSVNLNGEDHSLFISPVMDQWYAVVVIDDTELLEDTYSQLAVNIMVSLITFGLIAFFYYISYKNELLYGRKVEEMNIEVVTALAAAIDAKDNYTNGHSSRVAEYARMIAERCGYSAFDQDEIYMMGLLHDVGKIGVPDEVINKTAKLTDEEFELIRKHPVIGNSILESIKERPKLAIGARWHHERYDGKGYPDGLAGEAIPEEARIIAVADAYDAMTSKRSYRDVLPRAQVIDEIKKGSGTQFDPRFAEAMLQLIEEDPDYLMQEKRKESQEN